jgi:hypothetical protein
MTSRLLRASALAALAAAGLAAAPASRAEEPACPAIDLPAAVSSPALRAAVDPATGAPRALTAEERQAFALRRSAARAEAMRQVRVVTHPNGMKTAELGEGFLMNVVVETHPDGTTTYRCVPGSAKPQAEKRELK